MRNLDKKGTLLIFALSVLALGIFLYGVLARAQTRTNTRWSLPISAARVTVRGTVEKILKRDCSTHLFPSGMEHVHALHCTELVLSTKGGLVNLLLGPPSFIRQNHFFFVIGDQVVAIGFRAPSGHQIAVVAQEVVKSKCALAFRNSDGRPLWKEYEVNKTPAKHETSQAAGHSSTKPLDSAFHHSSSSKIAINPKTSESPKEKENAK